MSDSAEPRRRGSKLGCWVLGIAFIATLSLAIGLVFRARYVTRRQQELMQKIGAANLKIESESLIGDPVWRTRARDHLGIDFEQILRVRTPKWSHAKTSDDEMLGEIAELMHLSYVTRSGTGILELELGNSTATDLGVQHLGRLSRLQSLNLRSLNLTDTSLAHLRGLHRLTSLVLPAGSFSDQGLDQLLNHGQMVHLHLSAAGLTDAGLQRIGKLEVLERLYLDGAQLTDTGLVALDRLHRLTHLSLDHTGITDKGLEYLTRFSNLEQLFVNDTSITDAGLVHLAKLKKLTLLALKGTQITDAGVDSLTQCVQLRILDVRETQLTVPALEKLSAGLVDATISRTDEPMAAISIDVPKGQDGGFDPFLRTINSTEPPSPP